MNFFVYLFKIIFIFELYHTLNNINSDLLFSEIFISIKLKHYKFELFIKRTQLYGKRLNPRLKED